MSQSILKEEINKVNLSQSIEIGEMINIQNIINHDFNSNNLKINGFCIDKKERYYFIKKSDFFRESQFFNIYNKIKDCESILIKYKDTLLKIQDGRTIITSDINKVANYIYYDLILYFELAAYKHYLSIDHEYEKEEIHKILGRKLEYSSKSEKKNIKQYVRSTLVQRSINAKYWNRYEHSKGLRYSILSMMRQINAIEIELPLKYESEKVFSLLKDFSFVLNELKIENKDFEVRFKKLGHYKKQGLYIKNAKTLIIDPRYSETIYHELGHFIYETGAAFYLNNEKITKRKRGKIVKEYYEQFSHKLKNHKIEDLDAGSEIFAYWLENFIKKDILLK